MTATAWKKSIVIVALVVLVLMEWRVKLEKEPTLLKPFQIDEIVRAVRRKLSNASR